MPTPTEVIRALHGDRTIQLPNGETLEHAPRQHAGGFVQYYAQGFVKDRRRPERDVHYEVEFNDAGVTPGCVRVQVDVEGPPAVSQMLRQALVDLSKTNPTEFAHNEISQTNFRVWLQGDVSCQDRDYGLIKEDICKGLQRLYSAFENTIRNENNLLTTSSSESMTENIKSLLLHNLNVILTGAPGTGKTYMARQVAEMIVTEGIPEAEKDEAKKDCIDSVQFHPGYDYSDFVVGMKPDLVGEGNEKTVSFEWKNGIFKKFADKAKADLNNNYVFLIDEINRADLSRVFGELFSLLEEEYRYPNNEKGVTLPNGESFVIPRNLYILGTMNDIDRSVESMDFALRRRFAWKEVRARDTLDAILDAVDKNGRRKINEADAAKLKNAMNELNCEIGGEEGANLDLHLGTAYQLGGAIFAKFEKYAGKDNSFENLWKNHIENTLSEYLRGRREAERLLSSLKKAYETAVGKTSQGDSTQDRQSATPETPREAPPGQA